MAKGKSKKKNVAASQPKMTPQRYIRERARKLPLGKCFINNGWQDEGLAQIVVTRNRNDGNLVIGAYLVDTYCLGVKDAFCNNDITPERLEQTLDKIYQTQGMAEISYEEAHNIIYGAIAFAEDAGITPIKDFALAKYVLEEDTEDVPLIEYEFGKDGKYLLICGENYSRDKMFIEPLKKRLGDKFNFIASLEYDNSSYAEMQNEMNRHPREAYSYVHPAYPASLEVKNQFIVSEFYDPKHLYTMPEDVVDKILSLPADEAAADISKIIMFEIGRSHAQIEEDSEADINQSVLLHSIIFLSNIDSNVALDAILEIMRQSIDFADYHFGDLTTEYLHLALYMAGKNDLKTIEDYMYEPGLDSHLRVEAPQVLAMIAVNQSEKRGEVIEIFRRLLKSMVDRLPHQNACDGYFAGSVMSNLIDINAVELIPEIREVFYTNCVDRTIAGNCEQVISDIKNPDLAYIDGLKPKTIEELYRHLKSFAPEEQN